jgi:hypothetical protein
MKVTKWVDYGCEVEVEVGADDIRSALNEAFYAVNQNEEEAINIHDILYAFSSIAAFLIAFSEEQITLLKPAQRKTIAEFLTKQGERFKMPVEAEVKA